MMMDDNLILTAKLWNGSSGSATIKDKKRCRIEFKPEKKSIEKENFGFDSYEKSKSGCLDAEALKGEYKRYEDIDGKEYFAPWVSMRKGQTIILKLKSKINGDFDKIEMSNGNFSFKPNLINKKTDKIEITCNAELTQETLVEVMADGKVAGAINFFPNTPKKVKLYWIVVGINKGDIKNIEKFVENRTTLDSYFTKAFNPAVIDIEIANENPYKLDIPYSKYKKHIENKRAAEKKKETYTPAFEVDTKIESFVWNMFAGFNSEGVIKNSETHKTRLIYFLKELLKSRYDITSNDCIFLFLTNLKSQVEQGELTAFNNGITNKDEKTCLMFLGNQKKTPNTEIPHEVMHALMLEHTFLDDEKAKGNQKHLFMKEQTDNYMDYNNTKKTTWKWQWEIMRK